MTRQKARVPNFKSEADAPLLTPTTDGSEDVGFRDDARAEKTRREDRWDRPAREETVDHEDGKYPCDESQGSPGSKESDEDDWRKRPLCDEKRPDRNAAEFEQENQQRSIDNESDDEWPNRGLESREHAMPKETGHLMSVADKLGRWKRLLCARLVPFQVDLRPPPTLYDLPTQHAERLEKARGDLDPDDVLQICIIATGHMADDPAIIHPIVRLHIVDETSGRYLGKDHAKNRNDDTPTPIEMCGATTTHETWSAISAGSSLGLDEANVPVNHVLPVATTPCHLSGQSIAPVWNDTHLIDIPFKAILSPEVLFLFEIVDFRHSHRKGNARSGRDTGTGLYGVAWAFLKPVDARGGINVATSKLADDAAAERRRLTFRLQLFDYSPLSPIATVRAQEWGLTPPPPPATPMVPAVYLQYLRKRYKPLVSTMLVRIHPSSRPEPSIVLRRPHVPMERETSDEYQRYKGISPMIRGERRLAGSPTELAPDVRSRGAFERRRSANECCVVPDQLLSRFVAGLKGAFTLSFSPTGRMLAVACCELSTFPIRLFDVAGYDNSDGIQVESAATAAASIGLSYNQSRKGTILVAELEGHQGLVYDLRWLANERHLLSASADGTAKLWTIGALAAAPNRVNAPPRLASVMQQVVAGYVYCAAFVTGPSIKSIITNPLRSSQAEDSIQTEQTGWLRAVTGAHDGSLRYWEAEEGREQGLLGGRIVHEGMVNTLQVDTYSGRIYSADSFGHILTWKREGDGSRFEHYSLLRSLQHPDFARKAIVSLAIHPRRRRGQLLVQAQQNCLNLVDLTTNKVVVHFKGTICQSALVRAVFSPDGNFVIAGSEDGTVCVWDAATGLRLNSSPFLDKVRYRAPICDVSWHPTQHVVAITAYGADQQLLVCYANRPRHPRPIVTPHAYAARLETGLDDPIKAKRRRLRLKELQERRRHLLAKTDWLSSSIAAIKK